VFHFESTNAFHGTGTLAIAFSESDAVGLDKAALRIYRRNESLKSWELVGGGVDLVSNTVTANITNLGTYVAAPPLPTGDLQVLFSTNLLAADGVSTLSVIVTNLSLNTGGSATQQWLFTATAAGAQIITADMDTNAPGVQVFSTNGALKLTLRAPLGGSVVSLAIGSTAGDAYGAGAINLIDNVPPATPSGLTLTAAHSRVLVSWITNSEPDLAAYRIYYRQRQSGPPWDGVSKVEGTASPVQVGGTNFLLRGLLLGTNYFVALSAIDTTGNESTLTSPVQITTTPGSPSEPTAVTAQFGADGTNTLMWTLSEDDGYNDRDVIRYDIFRAVLPVGSLLKIGAAEAGNGVYADTNPVLGTGQFVQYAVQAVTSNGLASAQVLANRLMADGAGIDNDGDGIPDFWEEQYGFNPLDPADASSDPAGDGLSNLEKYSLGRNPLIWDNLHFVDCGPQNDRRIKLTFFGQVGHNYSLQASTDLADWILITTFPCTNAIMDIFDASAMNYNARFYRLTVPSAAPGLKLALGSSHPLSTNGLALMLLSTPGLNYRIDASADLFKWTAITNLISTSTTNYFNDPAAADQSRRFYRAVMP